MVTDSPLPSTLPPLVVQSIFNVCLGLKLCGATVAFTGAPAQTSDASTEQLAETGFSSSPPTSHTTPPCKRVPRRMVLGTPDPGTPPAPKRWWAVIKSA